MTYKIVTTITDNVVAMHNSVDKYPIITINKSNNDIQIIEATTTSVNKVNIPIDYFQEIILNAVKILKIVEKGQKRGKK